jgi:hypothetical protein
MIERYYDAHLYLANWGTHRIMLRLAQGLLDLDVARDYCVADLVTAWTTGEFLVLDLTSEDEDEEWDPDDDAPLSTLIGIHAELAAGDLRPLYLAWLACHNPTGTGDHSWGHHTDDDLEPPVPPGLTTLTAAQRALVDFLRLDDDLLTVAARASPPLEKTTGVSGPLAAWVTNLPVTEKNRLLMRVVGDHPAAARREILRRFHDEHAPNTPPSPRHRQWDELTRDEETAWSRIDAMIATRKPSESAAERPNPRHV